VLAADESPSAGLHRPQLSRANEVVHQFAADAERSSNLDRAVGQSEVRVARRVVLTGCRVLVVRGGSHGSAFQSTISVSQSMCGSSGRGSRPGITLLGPYK
jgi:hypothetical protein